MPKIWSGRTIKGWSGYIERRRDNGVVRCSLRSSRNGVIVTIDKVVREDIKTKKDLLRVGWLFYDELGDFMAMRAQEIDEVWPA